MQHKMYYLSLHLILLGQNHVLCFALRHEKELWATLDHIYCSPLAIFNNALF